ncbi:MAG TPA: zf-HC2 domain-containing protein [Thermoanaerobaculia bacterium]|nr:zf-HC2 domain-containing protein [Thermoanaerobaculia bacterium]
MSPHPQLEAIAAFIESRLGPPEREEVAGHLDHCAECYEIYTESVRFQSDERAREEAEEKGKVLPFGRKAGWSVMRPAWQALAAVLVVGVGLSVWWHLRPLPPVDFASLTAPLANPGPLARELEPFDAQRGVEQEAIVLHDVVAFQAGATLVNLSVAIEGGDEQQISDFAQCLGVLFTYANFPSPEDQAAVEKARDRLQQASVPKPERLTALRTLEGAFRRDNDHEPDLHIFELGARGEAGRLAALGPRDAFFSEGANERFFDRIPPPDRAGAEKAIDEIRSAWPDGPLSAAAGKKLAARFQDLIEIYDVPPTEEDL